MTEDDGMIIRRATPADVFALYQLAELDSQAQLRGEALVVEVDGELRAALSLTDGRAIADPFEHTAELIELLRMRANQLRAPGEPIARLLARLVPARRRTA
jgi:hypothetical protein